MSQFFISRVRIFSSSAKICAPFQAIFPSFLCTLSELTSSQIFVEKCVSLMSYSNSRSLSQGTYTHAPFLKLGFIPSHLYISNLLLSLYSKTVHIWYACRLFDEMPQKDIASWTTIISSHAQYGHYNVALQFFQNMLLTDTSIVPNEFTCSTVLRCCTNFVEGPTSRLGLQLHGFVWKHGFALNLVVASALFEFYLGLQAPTSAQKVFDEMPSRDVISYTTMISSLLDAKEWNKAVGVYNNLLRSSIKPTAFTFSRFLSSCVSHCWYQRGKMVHCQSIRQGVQLNYVLKTMLVDMYCKCSDMTYALGVFRQTKEYDVALFTCMISGLLKAKKHEEAITIFREMESSKISPNAFTYAGIISACASGMGLHLGAQIHSRIVKVGLEHDLYIGNSLVLLYNKYSSNLWDPLHAFVQICETNVVSWTTLISAFVNHGHCLEAFSILAEMRDCGVEPNSYTLSTILKACNLPETLVHAEKVHAYIIKTCMDATDVSIGNSLLHVYSRLNRQDDAWVLFDTMPKRDAYTYTCLAGGLSLAGLYKSALETLPLMIEEGIKVDGSCLACYLSAAASSAVLCPGRQLHCLSVKTGLEPDISVSNSLLDMYSKCKKIEEAKGVFAGLKESNVVTFNALISGLIHNGLISEALSAFEDMRLAGIKPDQITFSIILQACNAAALVDVGMEYFKSMKEIYGLNPLSEQYKLLLNLLGRAGRLEEAACMVETMPYKMDLSICRSLLGWCKLHGNLVFGEYVGRKWMELDPSDLSSYRLLAGLYDDVGRHDLAGQMRVLTREKIKEHH